MFRVFKRFVRKFYIWVVINSVKMVSVKIDFKKRDFVWIGLVVVLLCVGFGVAAWDNSKVMFHDSADVKITIGGEDYSLQNASDLGLIGGGMKFGAWVDVKSSYVLGSSIEVQTDGFVVLYADPNADDIIGYTGTCGSEVAVLRNLHRNVGTWGGFTMPVRGGDCWKVTADGTAGDIDVLHWIPIISSGGSTSGNFYQAIGTDDISSSATSYVDMQDMALTVEGPGNFLVMFAAPMNHLSTDSRGWQAIVIDGDMKVEQKTYMYGPQVSSMQYAITLGVGSHDIKVQWKRGDNNAGNRQRGATDGDRVLTVVEL